MLFNLLNSCLHWHSMLYHYDLLPSLWVVVEEVIECSKFVLYPAYWMQIVHRCNDYLLAQSFALHRFIVFAEFLADQHLIDVFFFNAYVAYLDHDVASFIINS